MSPARCRRQAGDKRQTLDLPGTGLPLTLTGPRTLPCGDQGPPTIYTLFPAATPAADGQTPGGEQLDTPTTDPRRPDVDTGPTDGVRRACQVSLVLCAHPEDTEHSSKEPGAIQNATAGDSNRLETLKQNRSHQTQTADSSLQMLTRPAGPRGHVHPEVARISDVRTPGHRHRVGLRRAGRAAGTRERGALGRHGGGGHGARPGVLHHGDPSPHSVKTLPPHVPSQKRTPRRSPQALRSGPCVPLNAQLQAAGQVCTPVTSTAATGLSPSWRPRAAACPLGYFESCHHLHGPSGPARGSDAVHKGASPPSTPTLPRLAPSRVRHGTGGTTGTQAAPKTGFSAEMH